MALFEACWGVGETIAWLMVKKWEVQRAHSHTCTPGAGVSGPPGLALVGELLAAAAATAAGGRMPAVATALKDCVRAPALLGVPAAAGEGGAGGGGGRPGGGATAALAAALALEDPLPLAASAVVRRALEQGSISCATSMQSKHAYWPSIDSSRSCYKDEGSPD